MNLLHELMGCEWGHSVKTADDQEPCSALARQLVVVHDGPFEIALKLCERHRDRVLAETTPRAEGPDPGEDVREA